MGRLIGLALALTHLIEAEGRTARRNATKVLARAATLFALGAVFLIGVVFALIGLFMALESEMGPAAAGLITGLATMALSGGAAWLTVDRGR